MNNKISLSMEIVFSVITALLLAIIAFFLLNKIDKPLFNLFHNTFITQESEEKSRQKEVALLQEYVTENEINKFDFDSITEYVNKKPYIMLVIYDGKRVVYDSSFPSFNFKHDDEKSDEKYFYRPVYNVNFADGDASIELMSISSMYHFSFFCTLLKIFICFILFMCVLLLLIRRKTKYIQKLNEEVNILESGNLNYKMTIEGKDEITYLAQSIDSMRLSIIERLTTESEAVSANHKLVTAMSHDLRTPLTILIGFLEILENQKYANEEQLKNYIHKSRDKAYQIKQLSDKLFEYFLAYNLDHEHLSLASLSSSVLKEIVEDYIFSLKEKNYKVKYTPLNDADVKVLIDVDYIHRVFANIFSNIMKYADIEKDICISCENSCENSLIIKFENYISSSVKKVESTNIGLETCKKIMSSHEGKFEASSSDSLFAVSLTFPIDK